jgi:hypothetical protein
MLSGLAALHPAFGHWNQQGYTEVEWSKPFCAMPPNVDSLTAMFERGRHYTDATHQLMPQLGYSLSAWNGDEGADGVSMRLAVGAYGDRRDFPNMIDLEFERLSPANVDLINVRTCSADSN